MNLLNIQYGGNTVENLQLPKQRINVEQLLKSYPELKNVNVSKSYEGMPVLLLGQIGQMHANLITNRLTIQIPNGGPFISKTKLGWAVHAPVSISGKQTGSFVCYLSDHDSLEEIVSKQYELENIDLSPKKDETDEDLKIIEQMQKSIRKCNDHYEIGFPWKENVNELPNSLSVAKQILLHLEKALLKDEVLLNSNRSQIESFLRKSMQER